MLDVRKLRLLRELAHRGTIAAVADALAYTPSAVSQQLAALEREAGVPLLRRTGRRAALTPAGAALAEQTEAVLALLEQASAPARPGPCSADNPGRAGPLAAAEQVAGLPGDLQGFPGGDDQGSHGRSGCGDVTVGLAPVVAGGAAMREVVAVDIDGDAEEGQPLGRPPSHHGRVLADAAGEREHVDTSGRRAHRGGAARQPVGVDIEG